MSEELIRRSDAIKAVWGDDINPSEDGMVFEAQSHIDRDIRLIPSADRPQPSIDIEPKRGEWIDKGWKGDWQFETDGRGNCWYEYECSECGSRNKGGKSNFCPYCGADMREHKEK